MEMMTLTDTNIFLEILLKQEKNETCKTFLAKHEGNVYITDFSFHSIGVICFKYGKEEVFEIFLNDIMPQVDLLTLPIEKYSLVLENRNNLNLDFDDAYQYAVAKHFGLSITTMDADFKRVKDVDVIFL
jgi:predicted nucleic acid-binding protein